MAVITFLIRTAIMLPVVIIVACIMYGRKFWVRRQEKKKRVVF